MALCILYYTFFFFFNKVFITTTKRKGELFLLCIKTRGGFILYTPTEYFEKNKKRKEKER